MKLVPESLYEAFERGQNVKTSMGIGNISKLEKELKHYDFSLDDIIITDDFSLAPNPEKWSHSSDRLKTILMGHMDSKKSKLAKSFMNNDYVRQEIQKALEDGIPADSIEVLLKGYANKEVFNKGYITLQKYSRTEEEERSDDEQNIYIFLGYPDKVPVEINGKKYFEEKWAAENMVKIDKYNPGDLAMVSGLKARKAAQGIDGSGVYMLTIDKEIMDDDNYYKMPDYISDSFDQFVESGFIKKI